MSHTPQLDATSTEAPSRTARDSTSRRAIVHGAAWSVPIVAATIAAPLAAASTVPTVPQVDLATVVRVPREDRNSSVPKGAQAGRAMYKGYRDLTFVTTYRNDGPDTVPAGATIGFGLAFAGYWDSFAVQENPSQTPITFLGEDTSQSVALEENSSITTKIKWWSFRVDTPLAPGRVFNLTYKVQLRDRPANASGVGFPNFEWLALRSRSRISVGSSGATDANAGNDRDTSNNFFAIDNSESSRT
jgi:hypothetical protein